MNRSVDEFLESLGPLPEPPEEDPIETIKQMIYDLMDLAYMDATEDPLRCEYSENTMSFLKSIEKELDRLAP